jgi:hypothetical protein
MHLQLCVDHCNTPFVRGKFLTHVSQKIKKNFGWNTGISLFEFDLL